jgi:hypothetical protein
MGGSRKPPALAARTRKVANFAAVESLHHFGGTVFVPAMGEVERTKLHALRAAAIKAAEKKKKKLAEEAAVLQAAEEKRKLLARRLLLRR